MKNAKWHSYARSPLTTPRRSKPMANAMTPERLAEIRGALKREDWVPEPDDLSYDVLLLPFDAAVDLLAEHDRLAAENERLCTKRKAFREGLNLIVKHDGTWKIGFVQHLAKMMLAADDDDTEAQS
jgi:hypothetical protein